MYNKSLPSQLPKLRFLDRFMAGHAGYIAGGCFKHLFVGEKIKDVDVFFVTEQQAAEAKKHFTESEDFSSAYQNDRLAAFRCKKTGTVVELIFSFVGDPETVVGNFDFTLTKAFYSKNNETGEYEFFHHERFFEHLTNKKLVIDNKVLFPISTFNRTYRYAKYGFGLCGESKQKLIESLQGATPTNMVDFYFGID